MQLFFILLQGYLTCNTADNLVLGTRPLTDIDCNSQKLCSLSRLLARNFCLSSSRRRHCEKEEAGGQIYTFLRKLCRWSSSFRGNSSHCWQVFLPRVAYYTASISEWRLCVKSQFNAYRPYMSLKLQTNFRKQ